MRLSVIIAIIVAIISHGISIISWILYGFCVGDSSCATNPLLYFIAALVLSVVAWYCVFYVITDGNESLRKMVNCDE